MKKKCIAAFDTSNYTTSFAVVDEEGNILLNFKKLLEVKNGERGLRQSDAVFQHTVRMKEVSSAAYDFIKANPENEFAAIGYSAYPRDNEGSYMPCFLVGEGAALNVAAFLDVPCYKFSHQAGHIAAALTSCRRLDMTDEEFVAFHVSGGTTDIVLSKGCSDGVFKLEKIGGSADVNAGQIIDRVGVYMGLPFPSGAYLEELALKCDVPKVKRYVQHIDGFTCNLSGLENKAKQLFDETKDMELTALYTLNAVGDTLAMLTENIIGKYGEIPIIYSGGVMSCSILKKKLSPYSHMFAEPKLSSDNAVGIAELTRLVYQKN